ncbi:MULTISPECIES: LysR family transcriptional regulator [Aliivibrio]|jgi:DNA-binding transcriptional LysR family regulator|uniref:HTH-type transcriptional regulator, LysR family n=1 Tax=Aliivibrio salmonicida (strain LFI1238) TaxID=316275 RepID=B6EK75_ALISL|nr:MULTISPECIES: LysR family transcriptional regulator [Aliivibrio]AZL85579.1 LysR family transcriptional regulator [Aliivibrio salmonicida]MBB1315695.1 LysR family transcriptional regulator [Aliivibrio sp. SR45-2]CAQ80129.1 HTH-type transcriptional regulator, LysR family [Aliivibrio salmonicida LFI1238]
MAKDLFATLDLNLLRTFLILSQELNMRKASERLFVSQPAISQALQKLRNHFDDELFVKVHHGLKATPFSEELAESIHPYLDGLSSVLNTSKNFQPSELQQTLKIALAPQVLTCLSGALFHEIRENAPNVDLQLFNWSASTFSDLTKGKLDIAINYEYDNVPKELISSNLMTIKGCVIVRTDHPIKKQIATPHDFEGYELASLIIPGWNDNKSLAGKVLENLNIKHKIGFRSELPMALIDVVQHTNMYFPSTSLFPTHQYLGLRRIDLALDHIPLNYPIYSYYHQRHKKNALHSWLNQLITDLLSDAHH